MYDGNVVTVDGGDAEYGYCNQCWNPAVVVRFRIKHLSGFVGKVPPIMSLWICEECLNRIVRSARFRVSTNGGCYDDTIVARNDVVDIATDDA